MMRLYGKTSAELRDMFVEWCFAPVSRRILRTHPEFVAVHLIVAQYWSDDASDEVHLYIEPVTSPGAWPECSDGSVHWGRQEDAVRTVLSDLFGSQEYSWLDLYLTIVAFASFCKEGCTQEDDWKDSYSSYAIASRNGDDISVAVVGTMHQPHAENRWAAWESAGDRQRAREVMLAEARLNEPFAAGWKAAEEALSDRDTTLRAYDALAERALDLIVATRRWLSSPSSPEREKVEQLLRAMETAVFAGVPVRRRPESQATDG